MILVFTEQITSRVKYVFDVIFNDILNVGYEMTDDKDHFLQSDHARISYGPEFLSDEIHFGAARILFERGISRQQLQSVQYEGLHGLFPQGGASVVPFDPFASTFYFVSRYEEYLPSIRDHYGRYNAEDSYAYQHDILNQPLIDQYALHIRKLLRERYPSIRFPEKRYTFLPTYDVDSAYAYLHKGLIRNIGGYMKSFAQFDLHDMAERTKVLLRLKNDPFDTFEYQAEMHREHELAATYFFLLGDYDEYDKNIAHDIAGFQQLIKSISDHASIGIHPSFLSNHKPAMLKKEIQRLSSILNKDILKSRQHFLKLDIPVTYQNLLENGIKEDYTMGFASQPGFRAGICSPYYFYNLDLEVKTDLKLIPFALMDATLQYYLNLSVEQAIELSVNMIKEVKKVDGTFSSLWHNNSLSEENEWEGWKSVYEEMIKAAVP